MSSSAIVAVKKRERTQNWVPEEKNALFSLIKIHVDAIENKKIDATASAMKTLAWQQIYYSFRGRFSTGRDITRMREQWRRMKAQARIEMYTFAEKVRTLGAEEASKDRPSNLSISVWRLMEGSRKRRDEGVVLGDDCESGDAGSAANFQAILNKLTMAPPAVISVHEVKIENRNDGYNDENHHVKLCPNQKERLLYRLQKRDVEEQPSVTNQKRVKVDETTSFKYFECDGSAESSDSVPQLQAVEPLKSVQNTMLIFEAAQKEHNIKIRMLNMELERAELHQQTALNDLKTSELKKQLIQGQAAEFCR